MNKLIKDGKVAVLVSPGYGAGWSTWCYGSREQKEIMCMDAEIVQAFLDKNQPEVARLVELKVPGSYIGGYEDLKIQWVPVGTAFRIEEYDGSESLQEFDKIEYMVA